ncbi:MAG: cytochrome c [Rhodospirillales bacterium]
MALSPRLIIPVAAVAVAVVAAAGYAYLTIAEQGAGVSWATGPEVVALGEQVYAAQCASCHGADLEGQPNWQQRKADGRLPAPPHDPTGHTWHHPDQALFALTKFGPAAMVGDDYQSDMPGYEGVLSDDEIAAVLEYIKSTWPAEIRQEQARRTRSYLEQ